jgi:hypothetical protein
VLFQLCSLLIKNVHIQSLNEKAQTDGIGESRRTE